MFQFYFGKGYFLCVCLAKIFPRKPGKGDDFGKSNDYQFPMLKDNLPHNTYQIYVKPHLKNTQMTLECQIFDEKALEYKPVSFLDFRSPNRFPRVLGGFGRNL